MLLSNPSPNGSTPSKPKTPPLSRSRNSPRPAGPQPGRTSHFPRPNPTSVCKNLFPGPYISLFTFPASGTALLTHSLYVHGAPPEAVVISTSYHVQSNSCPAALIFSVPVPSSR